MTCCLVLLHTPGFAVNVSTEAKKLVVVDKVFAAGRAKAVLVAKDSLVRKGAGIDPDQIAVRLELTYDIGSAAGAFLVPPGSGWLVNTPSVAKFVNGDAPAGVTQVKVAVIKPGKLLKLVGMGLGDTPLDIFSAGDPSPGGVVTGYCLQNAGEEYCHCSAFAECTWKLIAGGTGAKLVCKNGSGNPTCTGLCLDGDGLCEAGCGAKDDDCTSCVATSGGMCDLGDGTIVDASTGLMWEKKNTPVGSGPDPGNLHDVDNRYTWAGRCTVSGALCQPTASAAAGCLSQTNVPVGCDECGPGEGLCDVDPLGDGATTTAWDWVDQINQEVFAGHSDWRLPAIENAAYMGFPALPRELESLIDCSFAMPPGTCIDPIFGPTLPERYWASTTLLGNVYEKAWRGSFTQSLIDAGFKERAHAVRAVRSPFVIQ